jgi:hypothetical protein
MEPSSARIVFLLYPDVAAKPALDTCAGFDCSCFQLSQSIRAWSGSTMAENTTNKLEKLIALGAEKLARLVLDAAGRDTGFKRLVAVALAGAKGPKAVAAVINRKIGAIERATGFVEWDRAKTFAADLSMTVKTIVGELGPADPILAAERLLRFIATHEAVFERIDDSNGQIQGIYEAAIDELGPLAAGSPEAERERLPDMIKRWERRRTIICQWSWSSIDRTWVTPRAL